MKKKITTIALAGVMAFSIAACGGTGDDGAGDTSAQAENNTVQATTEESVAMTTYQDILDEYTQQIQEATPTLVEEYNAESEKIADDINALAELSNSKVEELATICNDGVEEMASLMTQNGDEYETYEEWAGKLQDVYMEYAAQITDTYTSSATDISTDDLMDAMDELQ